MDKLGSLLATEVRGHLEQLHCHEAGRQRAVGSCQRASAASQVQLHFICHSLGGLVARAALPSIMEEAPKLVRQLGWRRIAAALGSGMAIS